MSRSLISVSVSFWYWYTFDDGVGTEPGTMVVMELCLLDKKQKMFYCYYGLE